MTASAVVVGGGSTAARDLARRLGLPLLGPDGDAGDALVLAYADGVLELRDRESRPGRGLRVAMGARELRRGPRGPSARQPLARAVGAPPRRIADASAGLGQDAVLLAALGHEVIAIERNAVLVALLRDGLRRALADAELAPILAGRLEVVEGDARTVLPALTPPPDVVYVDPMYPPKRKRSALPPKPIVIVRRLVGPDEDAGELLSVARRVALRRVVVKRPPWAPPLSDDAVASHAGKLARYDVFRPSPG